MDKALEQVIEAVKQASPHLWAAAQAKVAADIAVAHFWAWASLVAFVLGLALLAFATWVEKNDRYGTAAVWPGITGAMAAGAGAIGVAVNATNYIQIGMARDWYAIKALVELSPLK